MSEQDERTDEQAQRDEQEAQRDPVERETERRRQEGHDDPEPPADKQG